MAHTESVMKVYGDKIIIYAADGTRLQQIDISNGHAEVIHFKKATPISNYHLPIGVGLGPSPSGIWEPILDRSKIRVDTPWNWGATVISDQGFGTLTKQSYEPVKQDSQLVKVHWVDPSGKHIEEAIPCKCEVCTNNKKGNCENPSAIQISAAGVCETRQKYVKKAME